MEISGVRTVLVLCDRQHHFRDYFRRRSPDRAIGGCDYEFGQTRYVYIRGQNWRGLRPDETRWATLGPCPVANLERLNEAEAIASQYERIFLEEDEPRTTTQLRGMRVPRMFVDDPIASNDSEEYIEALRRAQQMMMGMTESSQSAASALRSLGIGLQSTARTLNPYIEAYIEARDRVRQPKTRGIGDTSCINNARDRNLRCAVNPCGPCEGCDHYEKRDD